MNSQEEAGRDLQVEQSFEEYIEGHEEYESDLLDFDKFLEIDETVEKLEDDKILGMVSMIESIFASSETDTFKMYSLTQLLISQCKDKDEMNNLSQVLLFREVARERIEKNEKQD